MTATAASKSKDDQSQTADIVVCLGFCLHSAVTVQISRHCFHKFHLTVIIKLVLSRAVCIKVQHSTRKLEKNCIVHLYNVG